jgi:hypothetical protein
MPGLERFRAIVNQPARSESTLFTQATETTPLLSRLSPGFDLQPGDVVIFLDPKILIEECCTTHELIKCGELLCVKQDDLATADAVHAAIATGFDKAVTSSDECAEKNKLLNSDKKPYKIVEFIRGDPKKQKPSCVVNYVDNTRSAEIFRFEDPDFVEKLLEIINYFPYDEIKESNQAGYSLLDAAFSVLKTNPTLDHKAIEKIRGFVDTYIKQKGLISFRKGYVCSEFVAYCLLTAIYLHFGEDALKKMLDINPLISPISLEEHLSKNSFWHSEGVWNFNNGTPVPTELDPVRCCSSFSFGF